MKIVKRIQRPYPARVAGTLQRYHYDPRDGVLECVWGEEGHVTAPSHVYLPDWFYSQTDAVELAPAANGFEVAATGPASDSLYLSIPPVGGTCARRLVVKAQNGG